MKPDFDMSSTEMVCYTFNKDISCQNIPITAERLKSNTADSSFLQKGKRLIKGSFNNCNSYRVSSSNKYELLTGLIELNLQSSTPSSLIEPSQLEDEMLDSLQPNSCYAQKHFFFLMYLTTALPQVTRCVPYLSSQYIVLI